MPTSQNSVSVSVCIFTYNFEKYISSAIESVLSQITSFPIEIIIGDDYSTDNTRSIVAGYHAKYPDIIKLNYSDTNKGGTHNWISSIEMAKGKYIALLDGDDLFSDKNKLQIQYNWLEKNPSYTFCFHGVEEFYDEKPQLNRQVVFEQDNYTIADFLKLGWFVRTGSTFFKNGLLPTPLPSWVYHYPYRFDTILQVMVTMHGNAYNVKSIMSKWRRHPQGQSYAITSNYISNNLKVIELSKELDKHTDFKHHKDCLSHQKSVHASLALGLLRYGRIFNKHLIPSLKHAGLKALVKTVKDHYLLRH